MSTQIETHKLEEIARRYAIETNEFKPLGGMENSVFAYKKEDMDYVLRIGRNDHMPYYLVDAEIHWVNYLAQHGCPVVRPLVSVEKNLVEQVSIGEHGYNVVNMEKIEGDHLPNNPDEWSDDFIRDWGRVVGKMHSLSRSYKEGKNKRYQFAPDRQEIKRLLDGEDPEILEQLGKVLDKLDEIPKSQKNYGLIHSDLHVANMLVQDNKISGILDFDRVCYKWFVSEIAVIIFYPLYLSRIEDKTGFVQRFFPLFMEGYNRENTLDPKEFEYLNYFISVRDVILYMYRPPHLKKVESPLLKRIMHPENYMDVHAIIKEFL